MNLDQRKATVRVLFLMLQEAWITSGSQEWIVPLDLCSTQSTSQKVFRHDETFLVSSQFNTYHNVLQIRGVLFVRKENNVNEKTVITAQSGGTLLFYGDIKTLKI